MAVLAQKLFVVFLVSVQCSGVTEDFEADCTITDNIKNIVRRLRLTSSKPFVEDEVFGAVKNEEIKQKHPEKEKPKSSKPSKHINSKNLNAKQNKSKRRHFEQNLQDNKNDSSLKVANKITQGLKSSNTTNASEQLEKPSTFDQREYLSHCKEITSKNTTVSECIEKPQPGMNMEKKCMNMYPETRTEENAASFKAVNDQTKPSPLVLGSCSYIDLTVAQAMCGPGYKANIEELEEDLHHSIFFDNSSGNIVYGVHREDRWQCCRGTRNMTGGVTCVQGTRC